MSNYVWQAFTAISCIICQIAKVLLLLLLHVRLVKCSNHVTYQKTPKQTSKNNVFFFFLTTTIADILRLQQRKLQIRLAHHCYFIRQLWVGGVHVIHICGSPISMVALSFLRPEWRTFLCMNSEDNAGAADIRHNKQWSENTDVIVSPEEQCKIFRITRCQMSS